MDTTKSSAARDDRILLCAGIAGGSLIALSLVWTMFDLARIAAPALTARVLPFGHAPQAPSAFVLVLGFWALFAALLLVGEAVALCSRLWTRRRRVRIDVPEILARPIDPDPWWLHPVLAPVRVGMEHDLIRQLQRARRRHRSSRRARRLRHTS